MSQVNLERHHSKGWGVARHIKNLSCNAGDSLPHKKLPPRYSFKGQIAHDFFNPFLVFGQVIPLTHRHQLIFCGLARLEEEIVEFCRAIKPTDQTIKDRDAIVEKITKAIINFLPTAKVDTYGSYRTGLYLPTSDIDIVIFYDQFETELLEKVRKYLIKNEICEERHSYIINATVPIIRLNKVYKEIRIDISFNVINGPASALFIQSCLNQLPELQPLIYILKSLLIQWELNESYFGGLSSYSLSLLLINFLRFFPRSTSKTSLGSFLLEFLYHYGCVFNADTLGVSYQHGFFLKPFPSEGLVIIDALDPKNDVSRSSFKYREVQALFKGAYLVLSADISDNSPRILSKIFDRKSNIILRQINLIRKHGLYRTISNHRIEDSNCNRSLKAPVVGEINPTKIQGEFRGVHLATEMCKDMPLDAKVELMMAAEPSSINNFNNSGIKSTSNEIIYTSNIITNINNYNISNDNISNDNNSNIISDSTYCLNQSDYLNSKLINITQSDHCIRNNLIEPIIFKINTDQTDASILNENSNKSVKFESDLILPISKSQCINFKPKPNSTKVPHSDNTNDKINNSVIMKDLITCDINNNGYVDNGHVDNSHVDNVINSNCSTLLSDENFPKIFSMGFLNKDLNNDLKRVKATNYNANNNCVNSDSIICKDNIEESILVVRSSDKEDVSERSEINASKNDETHIDVADDTTNNNNCNNNDNNALTIGSCRLTCLRQPLSEFGQISNQSESPLYSAVVKSKNVRLIESPKKVHSPKKYSEILALPPTLNK